MKKKISFETWSLLVTAGLRHFSKVAHHLYLKKTVRIYDVGMLIEILIEIFSG